MSRRQSKDPTAGMSIYATLAARYRDLKDWLAAVWHLRSLLAQQDAAIERYRASLAENLQSVGDEVRSVGDEALAAQSIMVALDRESQDGRRISLGAVYALSAEIDDLRGRLVELERRLEQGDEV